MTAITERRTVTVPIELRAADVAASKGNQITGYAARYYDPAEPNATQYELWHECYERIMPGAFASALSRPDDVRALFNHDPNMILGRSTANTLTLSVDEKGLKFSVDLPDSPAGQTVAEAIRRGDITGCSFSFDVLKQTWTEDETNPMRPVCYRNIEDLRLYDVGPVTFPAYQSTEVDMNSVRSSWDEALKSRAVPDAVQMRRRRLRRSS
jgi:HK97 family phage prohead protease